MVEAQIHAAYDGARIIYGRNKARPFVGSSDPAGHAMMHMFIVSLLTVLPSRPLRTIRLDPKTNSHTIDILRAPPY